MVLSKQKTYDEYGDRLNKIVNYQWWYIKNATLFYFD